ncbi:MAG: ATP-binding protein [Longimicrobiales bacterium]|nr:ATP-binding protein [Longimicrobiales bacterium]
MPIPVPRPPSVAGPSDAEQTLSGLFLESPVPMAFVDVRSKRIVRANDALARLLGHACPDLEGRALRDLDAGNPDEVESHLLLALACRDDRPKRRTWTTASGASLPVELLAARLHADQGTMLVLYVRETSGDGEGEPAMDQNELRHRMAQKHEAVGRLATGLARELEGILARVVGSAESLQAGASSPAAVHAGLGEILDAGRDARGLLRDLLAFTGRQALEVSAVGLGKVVSDAESAIREAVSSDVGLLLRAPSGGALVNVDPARMQEVLVHLADHAADAMPDGGYLVVAVEEVELDSAFTREHPSTRPGPHVMLSVTDTGAGMDEEACARIFEPFHGAGRSGEESGMGLATAYGIVKQLGGSIWATSRPGAGTTFRIYFPKAEEAEGTAG